MLAQRVVMAAEYYELIAPRQLVRCQVDLDNDALGPNEIQATTEYTVVSPGTELGAWMGKPPLRPSTVYPRLMGYCNVARVVAIGSAVSKVQPDDYILTHQSHRTAFRCHEKEVLLKIDTDVDTRKRLAATYLYHLGYAALLDGGYVPGHDVAVVGLGALGFTTASLVCAFGGTPLVLTGRSRSDVSPLPLSVVIVNKSMYDINRLDRADSMDLVINTSDGWQDFRLCQLLARRGGRIILLGFPGRGETPPDFNPLDSAFMYDKQLTIRHSGHMADLDAAPIDIRFTLHRNMRYLAGLIMRRAVDATALTCRTASWRELPAVYARMEKRAAGEYSTLIEWID